MTRDHKINIGAIKSGTVIDHLPKPVGFKLLRLLFKLTQTDQRITIGLNNLTSGERRVCKDIFKIENTFLNNEQINYLALYAPPAT